MDRGPILVVAACIVRDEHILLSRRNQPSLADAHLRWELPGGKVGMGETPQEALRREIREELGTEINVVRLLPHLQTNLYHRGDGSVGHFVVVAFESVIARGAARPKPSDDSVKQFEWVHRAAVRTLKSLPGTARFIDCLERMDRASFDEANLYVRLERRDKGGKLEYWEFQCVPDLWGDVSLLERHVNTRRKSSQNTVIEEVSPAVLWERLTRRVRELVQRGYMISQSSTPLLEPLNPGS
jgi:ADP-ribose pyrophosphatase YjhB (NUDIX family)